MTTPEEVPMPVENLKQRMESDAQLWRQAYRAGQSAALTEAADIAMGPTEQLVDGATCRVIAGLLRQRAATIEEGN